MAASIVLAAGLLSSCRDPTEPASDVLTVDSGAPGGLLQLRNRVGEPVYYFVAERNTLALLDFAICVELSCPAVPPRGSLTIPYTRITGYRAGAREAVVFHWRLRRSTGGRYEADSVRALVVPL